MKQTILRTMSLIIALALTLGSYSSGQAQAKAASPLTNTLLASDNLVLNPGFEAAGSSVADAANWTEGTNHARASDKFHTGGWALHSTFRGAGTATRTTAPIAVSPNTTYTYSGYIWRTNSTGGACMDMNDIAGETQLCTSASGSWQFLTGTWNSGSNTTVTLRLITDGSPTGDIWFDDIALVGPGSPTAVPTNTNTPTQAATAAYTPTITPTSQITPVSTNTPIPTSTVKPTATSSTGSKAYYVSLAGNNTDGKSWATAWKGLGQVNWSTIQPGDTIYISGGTTSATYSGGIQISKSGTASGYIMIDSGANSPSPAGNNGTVIIDGGDYCIRASGSYLKIRNLLCQHATNSGFRIEGTGSILESNTVRETYGQGIHVHYCTSCVVRGNRITTFPNEGAGENEPYQTDGIVVYDSSDTLVEGNWIKLTNQYGPAHIDGIQAYFSSTSYHNITIRYNYVENTKAQLSNAQGVYLENLYGDVKVISNVVVDLQGNQAVASGYGSNFRSYIIGNTIKCGGYRCLWVANNPDPVIKNNLIWQTSNNYAIRVENWAGSASNIDDNLSYAPNSSTPFGFGSSGISWSSWQAKGFDAHGFFQNPNADSCLRPGTTSVSIDKGAILTAEYNQGLSTSLCGSNGPDAFLPVALINRSSAWNIGAYEK